jgi:hypothetical protein
MPTRDDLPTHPLARALTLKARETPDAPMLGPPDDPLDEAGYCRDCGVAAVSVETHDVDCPWRIAQERSRH